MPQCRQKRASRRIKIMTWMAGSFLLSLQTIRLKHIFPNQSIWMQHSRRGQRMDNFSAKCESVGPLFWDLDTRLVTVVWKPCTQRGGDSVYRHLYTNFWSGTWQQGTNRLNYNVKQLLKSLWSWRYPRAHDWTCIASLAQPEAGQWEYFCPCSKHCSWLQCSAHTFQVLCFALSLIYLLRYHQ